MVDQINKWVRELNQISKDFKEAFSDLTTDELNWKPDAASWSIAQNVEHLIRINGSYFPVVEQIRKGKLNLPLSAKIPFIVNVLGNFLLQAVDPVRKKKMKTFPIWEPSKSDIEPAILEKFFHHQEQMKDFISNNRDLLEKGTVISSPANKFIVYKLEKAFEIIIQHEKRHLNQALEVKALIKKHQQI
jgi:hypothetical protein